MEKKRILTNDFKYMRFAIFVLGVVFTDAFFAHRYRKDKFAEFQEEMTRLALQSIEPRYRGGA